MASEGWGLQTQKSSPKGTAYGSVLIVRAYNGPLGAKTVILAEHPGLNQPWLRI